MNRSFLMVFVCACLTGATTTKKAEPDFVKANFDFAGVQLRNMLKADIPPNSFPRTTDKTGKLVSTNMYDWTPGFFPGSLWYEFAFTRDPALKTAAVEWTEKLESLQNFTQHHDLGFMMYCSYGNAYRWTGNEAYKDILIRSARSLCTRFSPVTGTIKSWNQFVSWHGNRTYNYPVIIDNMMNLELLFFAARQTGDTAISHVAVTHALSTMKNQIRKDGSSFHVVCYDSATGQVAGRETAQGYADNSTWSRGQAWGIYGFTMVYRETKDPRFLQTAISMADWYIRHLPADKVPYWDFNAGEAGYTPGVNSHAPETPARLRDASAAAITASALFELSRYAGSKGKKYEAVAVQTLHTLAGPDFRATPGSNANFLLKHSVGSIAHGFEIDVPLVYADYYFIEALYRYHRLLEGKSPVGD